MSTMQGQALSIRGVGRRFKLGGGTIQALSGVDLEAAPGEFISIVGASGCGKSTLLRLIVGLEQASEGEISVGNRAVTGTHLDCGMVFQESRLLPWKTVAENIAFGCRPDSSRAERRQLVQAHITLVGLEGFERALPHQLSGGMQQRVSIARALVGRPKILVLDEPFGALDALTRIILQQEILRIWEAERTTMVLVTHDIDEAIYLGDRVVVMSDRPGTVRRILEVPLARPRDRADHDFINIRKAIFAEFFQTPGRGLEYAI